MTFRATLAPNASFGERGLPGPGDEFDLRVLGSDQPIGRVVVRGLGQGREPEDQPIQNFTPLAPPEAEPPVAAPVIEVSDPEPRRTTIHVRRRPKPEAAFGETRDASMEMSRAEGQHAGKAVPVAATTATAASPFLPEIFEWLGGAASASLAAAAAAVLFKPTAANPGEEEALRQYLAAHGGTLGGHGFEPPPPSPPLPGLVPPSVPTTKPGEGGFTPSPPGKPVPGFTPAPPPVLVRPGRQAVENTPLVVQHVSKPSGSKTYFDLFGDIALTKHAVERMNETGVSPSQLSAALNSAARPGTSPGTMNFSQGGITAVVNEEGQVVTVY